MKEKAKMKRLFFYILGLFGIVSMVYGAAVMIFDAVFPPPPPPRGWNPPPTTNVGKIIEKIKSLIDEKVNEFTKP
jgi:hypothetical protein